LLLAPDSAASREYVCRACICSTRRVVQYGADDSGVAADRNRVAKKVIRRTIGRRQLLLLAPDSAPSREYVCRACIRAARRVVLPGADDSDVAADRDRDAEIIIRRAIGGGELLLLAQAVPVRVNTYAEPAFVPPGVSSA